MRDINNSRTTPQESVERLEALSIKSPPALVKLAKQFQALEAQVNTETFWQPPNPYTKQLPDHGAVVMAKFAEGMLDLDPAKLAEAAREAAREALVLERLSQEWREWRNDLCQKGDDLVLEAADGFITQKGTEFDEAVEALAEVVGLLGPNPDLTHSSILEDPQKWAAVPKLTVAGRSILDAIEIQAVLIAWYGYGAKSNAFPEVAWCLDPSRPLSQDEWDEAEALWSERGPGNDGFSSLLAAGYRLHLNTWDEAQQVRDQVIERAVAAAPEVPKTDEQLKRERELSHWEAAV